MTKPLPFSTIALVYNPDKPSALAACRRLAHWLRQKKIRVITSATVTAAMKSAQLVVALGGDGTVLRVAREVAEWSISVLGVNTGHLGFLAATELGAMQRTISRVLAGDGRLETRTLLAATGRMRGKSFGPFRALNDVVLRSGATGRVLRVRACVQGRELARYAGDGVVIATPTGSTAYNLAASGPIVHPDVDVLIMTPICPHSLVQRPLVLPASEILTVEVLESAADAILSLDGCHNLKLSSGDVVEVRRAPEQVQLLMDPSRTFYQVLQNKLKWGAA
jgi:NAD+ kinase